MVVGDAEEVQESKGSGNEKKKTTKNYVHALSGQKSYVLQKVISEHEIHLVHDA